MRVNVTQMPGRQPLAPGLGGPVDPAGPVDGAAPGRRERKKIETRAALEAAALRLFEEQGYERTTVEEIAEAADVAVRTFFRYFQSKQHILFGDVARDLSGRMRMHLAQRPLTESPVDAVVAAMSAMEQDSPDPQQQILVRMRLLVKLPELAGTYHLLFQMLHDVIAEYVAERLETSPSELYPQLIAAAATGSVKAALTVFLAAGGEKSLSELRDEAYAGLTKGLTHPAR